MCSFSVIICICEGMRRLSIRNQCRCIQTDLIQPIQWTILASGFFIQCTFNKNMAIIQINLTGRYDCTLVLYSTEYTIKSGHIYFYWPDVLTIASIDKLCAAMEKTEIWKEETKKKIVYSSFSALDSQIIHSMISDELSTSNPFKMRQGCGCLDVSISCYLMPRTSYIRIVYTF